MTKNSAVADLCLEKSPCGIMMLDSSGQIQLLNPALEAMLDVEAGLLIGQTRETVSSGLHGLLEDEGAVRLFSESGERWLQCQVQDLGESGTVRFFLDITDLLQIQEENSRLRQQLEELAITDELTGLANSRAFTRALESHITRSRRYQNPLSLVIIELLDQKETVDPLPDALILLASQYLRDRLRWVDLIARWEQNQFIVALPETRREDCMDLVSKVRQGFPEISLPDQHKDRSLTLCIGLAQWQKGYDSRRLIKDVTRSLHTERDAN